MRCLDETVSKFVSNIVDGSPSIRVRTLNSSVGIATLLSGAVDVAVAEGEVLVLVLGVVLGAADGADGRGGGGPHLGWSCNRSRLDERSSDSLLDSNDSSWDSSPGKERSSRDDSSYRSLSDERGGIASVAIVDSTIAIVGIQSISISLTRHQGNAGQHNLNIKVRLKTPCLRIH